MSYPIWPVQTRDGAFEPTPQVISRFWAKVIKGDGCWEWKASLSSTGYGHMFIGQGKYQNSHVLSWQIHFGPIPNGLCVLHHCDNRSCVRPGHLWLGTKGDNSQDMVSKHRHRLPGLRGAAHPQARLDEASVRAIRASRASHSALARVYGVTYQAIANVRQGRTWAHVV